MAFDESKYRDPDRGFREFGRWEIVAPNSAGKWVPNKDDKIHDWDQGYFRVVDVDPTTGYSTLVPWSPPVSADGDADAKLVAVGPGYSSESFRMFLDTSVTPHTLTPDYRLHSYHREMQSYVVFLGSDISEQFGKIISAMYDPSGTFLGVNVPIEEIYDPVTSKPAKAPAPGYTSEELENGQLVTVVFYGEQNTAVSQAQLLIVNSKAIRRADASKRYVQGIHLDSPFISSADPQVVEFPLNVTVESLPLTAVVSYSDGTQNRLSINGQQFNLWGLRNYIATEIGQQFPMQLNYLLADDEISFNMVPSINRSLTVDYIARTVAADGAYEVKLFAYPVWVSAALGYRMEFWMYNLDRQTFYNVTPYVELGTTSNAFDPKAYGIVQEITWAIDINKVDGRFAQYRHVQTFRIALLNSGDNQAPNWEILFTPNQPSGYGRGLIADMRYVSVNNWRLNLGMGNTTMNNWLNQMYYPVKPLFNIEVEEEAPQPTHFILQFLNNAYEFPVGDWNKEQIVNNDLANGELLYIRWIRRTYDSDLHLATTALAVMRS
jgi:hypothetical protein